MRKMATPEEYRHMPVRVLALFAQRIGVLFASAGLRRSAMPPSLPAGANFVQGRTTAGGYVSSCSWRASVSSTSCTSHRVSMRPRRRPSFFALAMRYH